MYLKADRKQLKVEDFILPFGGELQSDNRWVTLADSIPWNEFEDEYASHFSKTQGPPSLGFRVALGSLIIKERLGVSDEETVNQIQENPYLQFFVGFMEYHKKPPFDSSMMTHFRKRLPPKILQKLNDAIVKRHLEKSKSTDDKDNDSNGGTLIVDATCTPADIRFPTDLSLLNESREKSEEIIDLLWSESRKYGNKPRIYRKTARKSFLSATRKKRLPRAELRKAIRKQLNYLRRNLAVINEFDDISSLTARKYRALLIITETYRQQRHLFETRTYSIPDRIVSISQPHIRPILRGKAGRKTEFGGKLSISVVDGFSFVDHMSFDNFNEACFLQEQIENYKRRFGSYPARALGDQIYRNRKNRKFCSEKGIDLSGKPLGRPPKSGYPDEIKQQWRQDECDRVPVEGKFGQLKRRFSLGRIMAKLAETSKVVVNIAIIVVNLEKILQLSFFILQFIGDFLRGEISIEDKMRFSENYHRISS